MHKKFVPLNSDESPTKNPFAVCTYVSETLKQPRPEWLSKPCNYQHDCKQNSTLDKVLTLQDEVRHIHERAKQNIFLRSFREKCRKGDHFTSCVVPQRTTEQLRLHAVKFENVLKVKSEIEEPVDNVGNVYSNHGSLIKLKDPFEKDMEANNVENIGPELASPECSREFIFVPSKRLVRSYV